MTQEHTIAFGPFRLETTQGPQRRCGLPSRSRTAFIPALSREERGKNLSLMRMGSWAPTPSNFLCSLPILAFDC
jgi:hypothetical protein